LHCGLYTAYQQEHFL